LARIRKWIDSRVKKPEAEYDEAKREFEMALGKPFIIIRVEIPEGFDELRSQFLHLEKNEDFLNEVEDLIKKRLTYDKHGVKSDS
jgi:hypothetical protein